MAANTSTRLQMIFDMYGVDIAKLNPSAPAENETGRNIPDIPVLDFSDGQPFVPDPTYGDFMPVDVERPDGAKNTVGDYPAFIHNPVYGEFMLTNLERPHKDAYVDSILDSETEQLPGADSLFVQPATTETGSSAIGVNPLNTPYEDDTATIAAANAAIM